MLSLKGYRKRVLRRVSLSIRHLLGIFLEKKEGEKVHRTNMCEF
mgnify:FL=1